MNLGDWLQHRADRLDSKLVTMEMPDEIAAMHRLIPDAERGALHLVATRRTLTRDEKRLAFAVILDRIERLHSTFDVLSTEELAK